MTDPPEGFVFAVTGDRYVALARRAVRSLRRVMPRATVDLFTDAPLEDPAFDRVHRLHRTSVRPKMEALRRSRFERTIYLDADVVTVPDLGDVFALLTRFDIAGAHPYRRNWPLPRTRSEAGAPPSFPQINSAVLGLRRNPGTTALLEAWEHRVLDMGAKRDQPALRDLLWQGDLRVAVLPPDYNMMSRQLLRHWDSTMAAPRLFHVADLHRTFPPGDPETPFDLDEVLGRRLHRHLRALQAADASLGGDPGREAPALSMGLLERLRRPGRRRRRTVPPW